MDVDENEQNQIACLLVVEDTNLFAAVFNLRRRQHASPEPALKAKVGRRIYDRPIYTCSRWWLMLRKGDCKMEGHPQNRVFRRRFSVLFSMFKAIVSEAREWIISGNKKIGDVTTD